MVMHRVEFPSRGGNATSIGPEAFVGFAYLGYIPRADFFGERESLPKSRACACACNCSGNDKADSVASEVQRDAKTENEREGKASFYGALNSDEVARPIYRRGGREGDPNYPGTDKQTADEVG